MRTFTPASGSEKARKTEPPAGRYSRPAASSSRRKSPIAWMRSSTPVRAWARSGDMISVIGGLAVMQASRGKADSSGHIAQIGWARSPIEPVFCPQTARVMLGLKEFIVERKDRNVGIPRGQELEDAHRWPVGRRR